jgi:hypothetical protein
MRKPNNRLLRKFGAPEAVSRILCLRSISMSSDDRFQRFLLPEWAWRMNPSSP